MRGPIDWDDEARQRANEIRNHPAILAAPAHCRFGAEHAGVQGVSLASHHGDFAHDENVRLAVTALRQWLDDVSIRELDFGQSEDGGAWVMMVAIHSE
jgi:hypothetical protein